MRPDGQGTDERVAPQERPMQTGNSVERDVMKLALAFVLLALVILGSFYLSKRATMPDLSENNTALQESPAQ